MAKGTLTSKCESSELPLALKFTLFTTPSRADAESGAGTSIQNEFIRI